MNDAIARFIYVYLIFCNARDRLDRKQHVVISDAEKTAYAYLEQANSSLAFVNEQTADVSDVGTACVNDLATTNLLSPIGELESSILQFHQAGRVTRPNVACGSTIIAR